jgi:hypothetical protein
MLRDVLLERLAVDLDAPKDEVSRFVRAARTEIDALLTEGWTVIAWPLILGNPNDPVFD